MLSNLTSFQFNLPFSTNSSPKTQVFVLIPAIYEKLVAELKDKQEFDNAKMTADFFHAAQYIYQAEPRIAAEKRHQFEAHESYEFAVDDLFLVEITLFEEDTRFAPNVNGLDRYDAFVNLIRSAVKVEVSERLRMDTYDCLDWYTR
ncbi:hypothetical protein Lepto7376_0568 [[Leptolyngbya] sp. PCC 7376]|uniref:hypothetical protein n=1 Tax=[Leptolyngbya] sp. PCC 7376 TaxID=111781 RepID=UPI00029F4E7D|nr:hypothetical protein [[Leptolyngbya] sp. PCC 7376]AFY36994.1 hypothetical protein Lepto7376_0568 [[Leptolyngbya] sp. PCC 7376]